MYLKTNSYFPWHIKLVGAVVSLFGFAVVFQNPIIGVLMLLSGPVVFFTDYYFWIDENLKVYQDGVSIFGLRLGKGNRYQSIEYLFVKRSRVSQQVNSRIQSNTIVTDEFDGYIRFSETEKVHLFSSTKREAVIQKIDPLAKKLRLEIVDYSQQ